jgi:hypothetical protein
VGDKQIGKLLSVLIKNHNVSESFAFSKVRDFLQRGRSAGDEGAIGENARDKISKAEHVLL